MNRTRRSLIMHYKVQILLFVDIINRFCFACNANVGHFQLEFRIKSVIHACHLECLFIMIIIMMIIMSYLCTILTMKSILYLARIPCFRSLIILCNCVYCVRETDASFSCINVLTSCIVFKWNKFLMHSMSIIVNCLLNSTVFFMVSQAGS